jgi:hypothetical protein
LIGGGVRDLACYASLVRFSDPSLVRANVRRAIDLGFRSLKLHEIALPAIRAAREEAGSDVELMLDVNCAWTLLEARARAQELEEIGLNGSRSRFGLQKIMMDYQSCAEHAAPRSPPARMCLLSWISTD